MRITAKGKVTIPARIRRQLGLHPGTDVRLWVDGGTVYLAAADQTFAGAPDVEAMLGRADSGMTTDEIMALTRGVD